MRAYCSVPDCYAPKSKYQLFHIPFNKETSLEWRRLVGSREEADKWHNAMVCEQVRMNITARLCAGEGSQLILSLFSTSMKRTFT